MSDQLSKLKTNVEFYMKWTDHTNFTLNYADFFNAYIKVRKQLDSKWFLVLILGTSEMKRANVKSISKFFSIKQPSCVLGLLPAKHANQAKLQSLLTPYAWFAFKMFLFQQKLAMLLKFPSHLSTNIFIWRYEVGLRLFLAN